MVLALVLPPPPADAPPVPDAAFSMVGPVFLGLHSIWEGPEGDEENERWLRETSDTLEGPTIGHSINEVDLTAAPDRAVRSFAPESWRKIGKLRARLDPDGVFHSHLWV